MDVFVNNPYKKFIQENVVNLGNKSDLIFCTFLYKALVMLLAPKMLHKG